jgi:Spy/CpxP family protein refolding chaperone
MRIDLSIPRACALAAFLVAAPALNFVPAFAQPEPVALHTGPVDPIEQRVFPPDLIMNHANEISLTRDQRDRIVSEVTALQHQVEAIAPQVERARSQMLAELDAEPANEARVLMALDQVLDAERNVKRLHIATLVRIRNLLSPAQRARLDALR